MKVGFAVQKNEGLDSMVYNHFGSAPAFVIVDTEKELVSALDNTGMHHLHGACNPTMALGGAKIDAMVVGGIGAGAIMKLTAMGIKIYKSGAKSVGDNILLLIRNNLEEITSSDSCEAHHRHCGHSV